jgi:hypothetical protein
MGVLQDIFIPQKVPGTRRGGAFRGLLPSLRQGRSTTADSEKEETTGMMCPILF